MTTQEIIDDLRKKENVMWGHYSAPSRLCTEAARNRLEELQLELTETREELAQAIAERTPHDYGILKEEAQEMRRQRDEARAEVERLKAELHDAQRDTVDIKLLDKARAEVEQLKIERRNAEGEWVQWKKIAEHRQKELSALLVRPEPSRLEIAAMLKSGWFANPDAEIKDDQDPKWWIEQADALIAAAKETQE